MQKPSHEAPHLGCPSTATQSCVDYVEKLALLFITLKYGLLMSRFHKSR
jgi:hypothetical protein